MAAGARGGDSAVPDAGEEDDGRERCVGCVSGGGDEEVCAAGEEEENDRAASSSSSSVLTTAASRGPPPSPPSSLPSTTPPRHRSRSTAAPTLPSSSSSSALPSLSSPPSPPRPSRWPCRSTSSPGMLPSPTSSRRRPSPTSPSPRRSSGSTSSSPPLSSPSPISVLGTFITEGDKGAEICKKVLATEASAQMYAERLTELAATLGFDGWLMNIEVDLDIQFIDNLKEFIKHLTKTMHDAVLGSLVIWYDAITVNGDLAWQNKLNEYNNPFFDLCDGFFFQLFLDGKDPEDSAAVAGDRKYDVYMGIDVFGRNTFGGGQWNETSLELVVVGDDGVLQSICEQTTFGIIKDIGVLDWRYRHFGSMPKIEGKEILVVLSDSGKLSLLYFCSEMHRFFAVANIELSEPGNLRHQLGRILAIDRESSFVAVSAYEDEFAFLRVSVGHKLYGPNGEIEEDAKIISGVYKTSSIRGTVWSMCFISTCLDEEYYPVVAVVINRKGSDVNDLSVFGLDSHECTIKHISSYSETGPLALEISEIPQLYGFALLFRAGDVLLMDLKNPKDICCIHRISLTTSLIGEQITVDDSCRGLDVDDDVAACALLELRDSGNNIMKDDSYMDIDGVDNKGSVKSRIVCSWSWEPSASRGLPRLIFCLDDGEFHILEFSLDTGVKVFSECVHRGLPCKPLLWMNKGMIAGFVEMGDGMILQLDHGRLVHKSSIQNVAPILDLAIADYHGEKQDQMFACCGMCPEGSLRVIRNGVNVEKLLRTEPIYQGVTGLWTLKMKRTDIYHSFLVLSFVEETRILSVGLSFNDISDAVGFQPDVCTLACGLVADGLLVQIHSKGVKLCLPTAHAHPEGAPLTSPVCADWYPHVTISVGAVGHDIVVVATSNPCCLYILGVRSLSSFQYELYETQHVQLRYEVSCISTPQEDLRLSTVSSNCAMDGDFCNNHPAKVNIRKFAIIGTHKPSVEIISLEPGEAFRLLSIGSISVNNALGAPVSGCIPENVRFIVSERFYILAGLRNGMLLRFESETSKEHYFPGSFYKESSTPTVNTHLQLIAIRRIGITPVVLVPLHDSANADIIVLSDRPWLLYAARHSLAYSSISFLPASHVTPVSSMDCPNGLLFVAESCLHLVEMVHGKRLNAQKFSIGGTPRKVLYHSDRTLLVLRTGLTGESCSSDVVQVDPHNGMLLSRFKCEPGETAKCMQIAKIGSDQVLIVGTSKSTGRPMMPNGEAESIKGRLIVLSLETIESPHESSSFLPASNLNSSSHTGSPFPEIVGYATEELSSNSICSSPDDVCYNQIQFEQMAGHLRSLTHVTLSGAVLAVYPYLDRYVLAAAGNMLFVYGFVNENLHRMKRCATGRTRFTITCLKTYASQIVVGDCRDGVLFYSYHENLRKLELIYSDPAQRLVGDVALLNSETAVVSDRRGSISVLSCPGLEVSESPEKNLAVRCSFYMGETAMSIQKAAFKYRLPIDDEADPVLESAYNCVVASTLLGSVFVMIPLTSEEHQLLQGVQERLSVHPLTAALLGNDHAEFRRRGIPSGVPPILDGDMLVQFLELTSKQQQAVLDQSSPGNRPRSSISFSQVMRTLERVHYALN